MLAVKEKLKYWQFILYLPVYLFFFFMIERRTVDVTYINIPFDDLIPFIEVFIVPYLLWFPFIFLAIGYLFVKDKYEFFAMCWSLMIGMTLFIIISFVFPNGLTLRPEVLPRDNVFTRLVAGLYSNDTPTNVLPSIHVFNSLVCGVSFANTLKREGHKIAAFCSVAMAALITISTMFVKQHSVVDVVAALVLSSLCFLLLRKLYHRAD